MLLRTASLPAACNQSADAESGGERGDFLDAREVYSFIYEQMNEEKEEQKQWYSLPPIVLQVAYQSVQFI